MSHVHLKSKLIGSASSVLALLVLVLLLTAPPASAHSGPFTYAGCTVTMKTPQGPHWNDSFGGTWADGLALANVSSGCGRDHQIWICYDYQYKRNDGTVSSWRVSDPNDPFRYAYNGCKKSVGTGANTYSSFWFATISYYEGKYAADCDAFRYVNLRTSAWVTKDGGRSPVYRSDLKVSLIC